MQAPRIAAVPTLPNYFLHNLDDGTAQMLFSPEEWLVHQSHLAIQRDLNKVAKWDDRKLITFDKHQTLRLSRNSLMHGIAGS